MSELTTTDAADLERLEDVVRKGQNTFIRVGEALMEIQERRLYRAEFKNFADYCRSRWNIGRSRAYQLISAAEVAEEVSTVVDKSDLTERAARELVKAPEGKRAEIAMKAAESGEVTSSSVRAAMDEQHDAPDDETDILSPSDAVQQRIGRMEAPFRTALASVRAMRAAIDDLLEDDDAGRMLQPQSVRAHIANIREEIKFARPYAVCPYCNGQAPADCKGCRGAGWVTKAVYDAAPEELKQ